MKSSILVAAATTSCTHAFVTSPSRRTTSLVPRNMGLFDGVKEAFGADGMGELDGDRETPIDRWMGWNKGAAKDATPQSVTKGMLFYVVNVLRLTW